VVSTYYFINQLFQQLIVLLNGCIHSRPNGDEMAR
jgi:hypothetical protein